MTSRLQKTNLNKNINLAFQRFVSWTGNPWRRYSTYLIIFFIGFFLGTSLGMINGTLALMDPIGAFFTVLFIETSIRFRRNFKSNRDNKIIVGFLDMLRIGTLYGLFMEGFKLL